jgi:hypothetical protein
VVNVETENSDPDPMLNYAYLGDDIGDGLFAWIAVAVSLSAVHYPYYTNVWAENGSLTVDGTSDGDPPGFIHLQLTMFAEEVVPAERPSLSESTT